MDDNVIVNKFAVYFKDLFRYNDVNLDEILRQEYLSARPNYYGLPLMDSHKIDTELVSNVIANLKRGKPSILMDFLQSICSTVIRLCVLFCLSCSN